MHPAPPLRRLATVALLAALGLAVTACSSDGSDGATGTTAPASTSTTAAPATTTTTTAPATTTTLPAAAGVPEAQGAAQALYDAWKAGDKAAAARVADPTAIDGMWLTTPGDYALYNHCDSGEFDTGGCLFRGDTGTIQFDLEKRSGNWVVADAFYADL